MSGFCSVSSSAVTDKAMKHCPFVFFLLLILNMSAVMGQGSTSIKATADKNRILIGEPLLLTIEAQFDKKDGPRLLPVDSIPHFEHLEKPGIDSVKKGEVIIIKGVYKLTSFDSGHWVIPAFSLSKSVSSDTIGIDVVFSEFDADQDYHDIKDIIEAEPLEKGTPWWWFVSGGLLLLSLILFYYLRKRKPLMSEKPVAAINPYEEAMGQLEKLSKKQMEAKEFHSSLTGIFRVYIFQKKGILSLQKTTDDLVIQLKELGIDKANFERLSQSLRLSDFVKFAKYNSSAEDDAQCLLIIKDIIRQIEKSGSGSPV